MAHVVQVYTFIHGLQHSCQQTTHKSEIVLVNGFKLRDELSFVGVYVSHVLFIYEFGRLFFYCQLHNPL